MTSPLPAEPSAPFSQSDSTTGPQPSVATPLGGMAATVSNDAATLTANLV
jgi:hypothetical protein